MRSGTGFLIQLLFSLVFLIAGDVLSEAAIISISQSFKILLIPTKKTRIVSSLNLAYMSMHERT